MCRLDWPNPVARDQQIRSEGQDGIEFAEGGNNTVNDGWTLVGIFAAVFAAVAAGIPFVDSVRRWHARHLGSRSRLAKQLSKLVVGVTSEHVRSLFGVPIMQRTSPGVDEAVDCIFQTRHAWVVTRERNSAVIAWSITVFDRKFKIDLLELSFGLVGGTLGRSVFSGVVEKPGGYSEMRGASTYAYAEYTYFGRPSAYQSFVFMYNTEGIGTFKESGQSLVATKKFAEAGKPIGNVDMLEETRKRTTVNTFLSCGLDDSFLTGGAMSWPVVLHDIVVPLRAAPSTRKKWIEMKVPGRSFRRRL